MNAQVQVSSTENNNIPVITMTDDQAALLEKHLEQELGSVVPPNPVQGHPIGPVVVQTPARQVQQAPVILQTAEEAVKPEAKPEPTPSQSVQQTALQAQEAVPAGVKQPPAQPTPAQSLQPTQVLDQPPKEPVSAGVKAEPAPIVVQTPEEPVPAPVQAQPTPAKKERLRETTVSFDMRKLYGTQAPIRIVCIPNFGLTLFTGQDIPPMLISESAPELVTREVGASGASHSLQDPYWRYSVRLYNGCWSKTLYQIQGLGNRFLPNSLITMEDAINWLSEPEQLMITSDSGITREMVERFIRVHLPVDHAYLIRQQERLFGKEAYASLQELFSEEAPTLTDDEAEKVIAENERFALEERKRVAELAADRVLRHTERRSFGQADASKWGKGGGTSYTPKQSKMGAAFDAAVMAKASVKDDGESKKKKNGKIKW